MSGDYRAVFEELANQDGFEKIFFAGYSMGGNLVTKMAGEFGANLPPQLRGVASVCPALNLAACADELQRWDNYFYEQRFVRGLVRRYAHKAELFPQLYPKNGFGPIRTVREFDDAITAPQFGFRDAAEYYESAGAKKVVGQIRVPYLLITAQDDPFVPFEAICATGVDQNPSIQFVAPKHGGHCGFVSHRGGHKRFWAEEKIVEFCCDQLEG
jgi:predicted alpha/beta-fold hydrolase